MLRDQPVLLPVSLWTVFVRIVPQSCRENESSTSEIILAALAKGPVPLYGVSTDVLDKNGVHW